MPAAVDAPPQQSESVAKPPQETEEQRKFKELVEATMKAAARAHGDFDRKVREWQGSLLKSGKHHRTMGSVTEKELKDQIEDGQEADKEMLEIETDYKSGKELTQDQIDAAKVCIDKVFVCMKLDQKLKCSVERLMKI